MFSNINSNFILKFIFSFIEDKQKLQIIIYNRKIQAKLDIDINYYRALSGKILKIDKNGIGKIYKIDTKEICFEGEYSNKKKNGKGIKYMLGKKVYEGEFKNGKMNGYGKEYCLFFGGGLVYEGEFKDGKKNGYGKEYDTHSNLAFEGEFRNNKRWNGHLIQRHEYKKILFEGEYKNGKLWNGKGYKLYNNEIDYEIINGNGKFKKYNDINDP
jgi:hypothetical protein